MVNKCAVFATMLCAALSSTPNLHAQKSEVKNIVLVHGAWADGSGWKGVYNILVKDGFNVSIVQEPETSFQDSVTAVKRILELQDGPSILVAHSYGGSVITEAARVHRLPDWCTLQRTCQTLERTKRTTESASRVTSAGLVR
jgi:pimeloyl-ACP methyl ester carboxylesterase